MKKCLLSVLAISLIFSLVGCGQSVNEDFIVSDDTTIIEPTYFENQNEVMKNAYIEEVNIENNVLNGVTNNCKWDNDEFCGPMYQGNDCPNMNNCPMNNDCQNIDNCYRNNGVCSRMNNDCVSCPNNMDSSCPMCDNCLTQNYLIQSNESACEGCPMANTNCSLNKVD